MRKLKKIVHILFFVLGNVLLAQENIKSFHLQWEDNVLLTIDENTSIRTSIVKDNLIDVDLNPLYLNSWNVKSGVKLDEFSIVNVVYKTVASNNTLYDLSNIPTNLQAEFDIVKERDNWGAVLNLVPLLKDETGIKRVVSFDLNYKLSPINIKKKGASSLRNSVLSSGNWFKFAIDTTGVYKIDKRFLQNLGIDVGSINPKNIQIFGNGGEMLPFSNSDFREDGLQENSIFVSGEEDGSFDAGDYVLFFGKGPHKWLKESYSIDNLKHQFNIFSDQAYYFITIGNSNGKRIQTQSTIEGSGSTQINNFDDYTFVERDDINLFAVGQQWFGDSFNFENVRSYSIPFKNIDTSHDVKVKVRGVAESGLTSRMNVKVNSNSLFDINFSANGGLTHASAGENSGNIKVSNDAVNVEITYNNNGNPSAKAFLDYIEVLGRKKLIADGRQFLFRNFEVANTLGLFEYSISNVNEISKVWNITDYLNITTIVNEASTSNFSFKANGGIFQEYIVLNDDDYYEPILLDESSIENQNLHSLNNIDYIIITPSYLVNQAQRLADYHIQNSNLNTQVIPLHQIYNEFSSGGQDVSAIRDFVKHLYDNSTSNKIKYVCLFGDASYDYKNRINGNNNVVPVFEAYNSFNIANSYVTDDYYGMMDANEGLMRSIDKQDVATGRIPVSDVLQAENIVNKILKYYSDSSFGDWRTHLTLVADDIDASGEEVLQGNMEKIADTISINNPMFNLKKVYIDAYDQQTSSGGNRYPSVNIDLVNQIEKGTLMVDYFGHGGEDGWSGERIFGIPEIQNLKNAIKLPLFVTVTCEFSRFDNPLRKTAGEYLLWNENGGTTSLISTTRAIYISVGRAINEKLTRPLLNFDNDDYSISEALMYVKNQFSTNQRFFIFNLGDPAMHLNVPKPNIKLTKMNDIDISQSLDTIKALSYVKFEGEVVNLGGEMISDFNGEISVSVYDKAINKSTLDNDNKNIVMEFDAIDSKIFKGRSSVENGKFVFDFITPKDIKIAYGKGKLSFYATNFEIDKSGYNLDVTVGGINENAPEDTVGPTVQMYMNDLNFVNGGNTNESPLFIAVIEDENGINTSITAVDHDIVAIIDGDESNPVVLNDYYETELNDYKKGKVKYPFRDLSVGLHTVKLKVWDTYNNLSETSFSFFVVDDSDLVLTNVLNYPNPFVNYTEFWFNHNKPNELLEVQVQIFTVSGKLVKTINQTNQSEGNLSRSVVWNGLDDFGAKIGKGVYVYKLKVKSLNTGTSSQKIEKLVILQ